MQRSQVTLNTLLFSGGGQSITHTLVLTTTSLRTKCEMSSFTCSKDMISTLKIENGSRGPD